MFRFKRAHLRSLAIARKLREALGLTPARYDVLLVLAGGSSQAHQYTLWRALGISRAAGSKMVRRLMELGLVTRWRSTTDRRTFVVAYTEAGAQAFRTAALFLHKSQVLRQAFELAFGHPAPSATVAVQNLDWAVDRTARRFGDTSWNLYPSRHAANDEEIDEEPDDVVTSRAS